MAANQDTYNNPAWGRPAPGAAWDGPGGDFRGGVRSFLDGLPRPVSLAMTVFAFILWWPVGLATLFYMIGSGRLSPRGRRDRMADGSNGGGQGLPPWSNWSSWASGRGGQTGSSGNHAFDEYRMHTLKQLEEEQLEFGAFLERLRFAKDKAEFDQFMAERRGRPPVPPAAADQSAA